MAKAEKAMTFSSTLASCPLVVGVLEEGRPRVSKANWPAKATKSQMTRPEAMPASQASVVFPMCETPYHGAANRTEPMLLPILLLAYSAIGLAAMLGATRWDQRVSTH